MLMEVFREKVRNLPSTSVTGTHYPRPPADFLHATAVSIVET